MLPTREEAEELLKEAEKCNPGPWGDHSRVAARCAERIAKECGGMDSEKAYILGLLHDIGRKDTTEEELKMIRDALENVQMDEYDRLIQLCDSMAGAEGVMSIEERMEDVRRRYGSYPQKKWDKNQELKKHFENKMGKDIYLVTGKGSA